MSAPTINTEQARGAAVPRTIGLHGRTAVFGAMAGGVALGGVLVAAMTLAGRLSGHALFLNATALFTVGAILGFGHGAVLGFFGRPADVSGRRATRDIALAALYAVPGLAVGWLASIWVAMTLIAAYTGSIGALTGVVLGWVAAAAILSTAAIHGVRALGNAYARWPERRAGTLVVAGTFAGLLVMFLADRPELWGTRIQLTQTGAILLAAFIAVWFVGPLVTVALRLVGQLPTFRPVAGITGSTSTSGDLTVGLVVGLVVGLIAVPFMTPMVTPTVTSTLVVEVGQAMVDEVLLRLFLVTAVTWLLLRWQRIHQEEAALTAVLVSALVQVALYTPGTIGIGFPTWTATAAFLGAAVAVPAVAFGLVYWKRGFGAALVADATALVAIALIV